MLLNHSARSVTVLDFEMNSFCYGFRKKQKHSQLASVKWGLIRKNINTQGLQELAEREIKVVQETITSSFFSVP